MATRVKHSSMEVDYKGDLMDTSKLPELTNEELKSFEWIDKSTNIKDQDGDTVVAFYRNKIDKRTTGNALVAARALLKNIPPTLDPTSGHYGQWRKSNKFIAKTKDLANAEAWYEAVNRVPFWENRAIMEICDKVDTHFNICNSPLFEDYCKIQVDKRYWGKAYLTAVVNLGGSGPHYDRGDEIEGLCCVVPLGNFDGGELVLREQKKVFCIKPGDIIFFRSRELLHENLKFTGIRYSMVFMTDHNSFTEYGQTVKRTYKHADGNPPASHKKMIARGIRPEDVKNLRTPTQPNKVYVTMTRAKAKERLLRKQRKQNKVILRNKTRAPIHERK